MRAVVYDRYGPPDVLRLEEVERPVPKEDEVLVKVHATTVNRSDVHTREANRRSGLAATLLSRLVSGLRRPRQRILGREFAGEVEAVGAAVTEFAVGDRVFGLSGLTFGAHAEFMCMRESARIAHAERTQLVFGCRGDQEIWGDPPSAPSLQSRRQRSRPVLAATRRTAARPVSGGPGDQWRRRTRFRWWWRR